MRALAGGLEVKAGGRPMLLNVILRLKEIFTTVPFDDSLQISAKYFATIKKILSLNSISKLEGCNMNVSSIMVRVNSSVYH